MKAPEEIALPRGQNTPCAGFSDAHTNAAPQQRCEQAPRCHATKRAGFAQDSKPARVTYLRMILALTQAGLTWYGLCSSVEVWLVPCAAAVSSHQCGRSRSLLPLLHVRYTNKPHRSTCDCVYTSCRLLLNCTVISGLTCLSYNIITIHLGISDFSNYWWVQL